MNDRFKFRVWDKTAKCWSDSWLTQENGSFISFYKNEWFELNQDQYIVQHCTGLKDSDQNLIWEGDILKCSYENTIVVCVYGIMENCGDCYKDSGIGFFFCYDPSIIKDGADICLCGHNEGFVEGLKIIGNIFEHPELLENNN